jgi:hypothetical protein
MRNSALLLFAIFLSFPAHADGLAPPIVVDGGARPTGVWRSVSGVCGGSRYGISIRPGVSLADSLRDLTVNGRSYRASAEAALRAWE